jgi:hypothetical protein
VLYKLCLEPDYEASEEAAKKRKQDAGAGSLAKRTRVSSRKTASAKTVVAKAAQSKLASRAKVVPKADVPPKVMPSVAASVSSRRDHDFSEGWGAQDQRRDEEARCSSIAGNEGETSEARCWASLDLYCSSQGLYSAMSCCGA